jgi:hypothetical protein
MDCWPPPPPPVTRLPSNFASLVGQIRPVAIKGERAGARQAGDKPMRPLENMWLATGGC